MPERIEMDVGMAELLREGLRLQKFYPALPPEFVSKKLFPDSGLFLYNAGEFVVHQGESARDIYLIQTGSVEVRRTMGSMAGPVAKLDAGSLFGEIALLQKDAKRTADVVAVESSRVYCLIYSDVQRVIKANPELGQHLISLARTRLGR